jgi:hypothetical protein
MRITKRHHQAIHLMILGPKGPERTRLITEKCGITRSTFANWKRDQDFQREYLKQLDQYRNNFDEISMAERKERVRVLNGLCDGLHGTDDKSIRLKMALLEQIRIEMGEGTPAQVSHLHRVVGVNLPPRASTYEDWLKQNRQMEVRKTDKVEEAELVPTNGHSERD